MSYIMWNSPNIKDTAPAWDIHILAGVHFGLIILIRKLFRRLNGGIDEEFPRLFSTF
jgi:hypothetical protein